jgi:hypothetical protein
LWWFILACATEFGEVHPEMGVRAPDGLRGDLILALETGERSQLDAMADRGLIRLGEDAELDRLTMRAALAHGDPTRLDALQRKRGGLLLDFFHPVVEQVSIRARRGEASWEDLEEAIQDCELLDVQPRRGQRSLDSPAASLLPLVAYALGADRVIMGRPEHVADPDPIEGKGALMCRTAFLVDGAELPEHLPRRLVVGAADGGAKVFISIRSQEGEPWAFITNDVDRAERLIQAALWWELADDRSEVRLRELFGEGL